MTRRLRLLIVGLVASATTAAAVDFPALDGPAREPVYAGLSFNALD